MIGLERENTKKLPDAPLGYYVGSKNVSKKFKAP